jgi:hypothetical protein
MSSPKIGRAYEKASNALAYQARKLREQATEAHEVDPAEVIDATVERLRALDAGERAARQSEVEARAAEIRTEYVPLIQEAERVLAENMAAIVEHGPFIRPLAEIDWQAVRARARNSSVTGSEHSTWTNLGLLQRAVEDAAVMLHNGERDLVHWLDKVKGITGHEPHEPDKPEEAEMDRQYAANGLRAVIADRATSLRAKAAAIRKLLAQVAADLDAADASLAESAVSA